MLHAGSCEWLSSPRRLCPESFPTAAAVPPSQKACQHASLSKIEPQTYHAVTLRVHVISEIRLRLTRTDMTALSILHEVAVSGCAHPGICSSAMLLHACDTHS